MKRKISILTIVFFLISQTIFLRLGPIQQSNAAELKGLLLTDVSIKDENGQMIDADNHPNLLPQRDEMVQVTYNWKLSESVTDGDQISFQVPAQFSIHQEGDHPLTISGGTTIGSYHITGSGNVTVSLNDEAENHANDQGEIVIPAQFNESVISGNDAVAITFNLIDNTKTINVMFASNNNEEETVSAPKTDDESVKEASDETNGANETNVESESNETNVANDANEAIEANDANKINDSQKEIASAQIKENIITGVTLTNKEGVEIDANKNPTNRPLVGSEVIIQYEWALQNKHGYKAGDTFEFQLPEAFELYNDVDGDLISSFGKVGTFKVTKKDNKAIMTFNDSIEKLSNIKGTIEIWSIFSKTKITGSTHQEIKFPIRDEEKTIIIDFLPPKGSTIDKKGTPDRGYNAKKIDWTIDFNKQLDQISNAIVKDPIQAGLVLQPESIKLFNLDVKIDGTVTLGEPVDPNNYDIIKAEDGKSFEIHFKSDINSAYRITYTTDITDDDGEKYTNKATLSGKEINDASAKAEVSVGRGVPLSKKALKYDSSTQTIEWEIKYNYNQKTIKKEDAKLIDLFSNSHKLMDGEFKVYKITLDDYGNEKESETKLLDKDKDYKITPTSTKDQNGFELQFKQDISSAYKIVYKTVTTDKVFDDGSISNTVKSSSDEKTIGQSISQEVLHKYFKGANYAEKTVNWEITFNKNNFEMNNAVLTDTFINKGLKLIVESLKIKDKAGKELTKDKDFTLESSEGKGFTIKFTNPVKNSYTVTFTTKFNDDWKGSKETKEYKNHALLTWKDEKGEQKEKEDSATFNPDQYTKDNGFKDGSYDATKKEITWKIGINYNLKTFEHAKVQDFLLNGQQLVKDSIEVYEMELTGGEKGVKIGSPVEKDQYTVHEIKDENNNPGFRIEFNEKIERGYYITFKTTLKDQLVNGEYENTATVFNGENKITELKASVSVKHGGEYVKKEGQQDGKLVNWKVYINRGQSLVSNAKIIDEPSANQILLGNSFKLFGTKVDTNGTVTKDKELELDKDYTLTIHEDEAGNQSFELSFKDDIDSAYILEYQSYLNARDKEQASNKVFFEGENNQDIEDQDEISFTVRLSGGSGTGSGETGQLTLIKVDADDKEHFLPGATFTLYDSTGVAIKTATTDEEGKIVFNKLLYDEYFIKEVSAPEGYVVSISDKNKGEKVKLHEKEQKVTIENKKIQRAVELIKVDKDNPTIVLKGAEFTLLTKDGELIKEKLITDKDGKISVSDLKPGDYQLVEIDAPFGYVLDTKPIPFTIKKDQTEVIKLTAKNTIKTGSFELTKEDEDDETILLEDAEFKLLTKDGELIRENLTTDKDGKFTVLNLKPGDYQLIETKAPFGYVLNTTPIPFTIKKNQTEAIKLTAKNKLANGSFELTKVDEDNETITLKGAEFKVLTKDGKLIKEKLITDKDGKIFVSDLKPGEYQLIETDAPYAYVLNNTPIPFTIKKNQTEVIKLIAKNSLKTGSFELTKVDEDDETITLEGAEFKVLTKDGKFIKEKLTTDKDGKISSDLKPGDYQLIETKAPFGYVLNTTSIPFTIKKNQTEVIKLTARNKIKTGSFELKKVDKDNEEITLEDAEFKLLTKNGVLVIDKLTTDKDGKIFVRDLRPGDYQLIETKAPFGYVLDTTPIPFTIEMDQTEVIKLTAKNVLMTGSFELTKVDEDNATITLEGAEFKLLTKDGVLIRETLTTDKDGKIFVSDLKPGDYQLIETKAPNDYEINKTPIEFTIEKGVEKTVTRTFENSLIPGNVILTKIHKNNPSVTLKGALFKLEKQDGTLIKDNLETDDQGQIKVENLKPGDYQFIETKAPFGYTLNSTPLKFTIERSQTKPLEISFENEIIYYPPVDPKGSVELTKVDKDQPLLGLENAVFTLKDQNGTIIKEGLTTDKQGKLTIDQLKPGTYQLIETKAPFGYVLDEKPITFTIINEPLGVLKITFTNQLKTGAVELVKVDKDDHHHKLAGAEFTLQTKDGSVIQKRLTTNKEGKLDVSNLKPGDYQLIETKSPVGYILNPEPIDFTISVGQMEKLQITFENEKVDDDGNKTEIEKGTVELTKVDQKNHSIHLENAVFTLKDKKGKIIADNLTTNKDGKLVLTDLKPGSYQFIETKAPKHYILDGTPIQFTIKKNQETFIKVTVENEKQQKDNDDDKPNGNNNGHNNNGHNNGNDSGNDPNNGSNNNSDNNLDNDSSDHNNKDQSHFQLPNTATNMYTWLFIGVSLLIIGSILFTISRRRLE
ncbi:SpaA isopeptide-forming pilin-related protein [Heyndrickxia sp. NPDC080065]|uniref:SpaA isopeptide-forming pilin-related protein n=1 Tax=Heyndrickxia sp. NPDC080065 TaxID=3390568 RepID=UPI003CFEF972